MISAGILLKRKYINEEVFQFFKELEKFCPELMPEKFDGVDPYKYEFNKNNFSKLNELLSEDFSVGFKNKKKVKIFISQIFFRILHSSLDLKCEIDKIKNIIKFLNFIKEYSLNTQSDYSALHNYYSEEKEFAKQNGTYWGEYISFDSIRLIKYIPDLYQCQIFGKSFVEEFGMDKLLSIPAPVVEKISDTQVYFQLVKDIKTATYEELSKNRILVKKHLGNEYFFEVDKGQEYEYKKVFKEILPEPKGTVHITADGGNILDVYETDD